MCQAGFIRNQFFKEKFFHGWNSRRVAGFGGEAGQRTSEANLFSSENAKSTAETAVHNFNRIQYLGRKVTPGGRALLAVQDVAGETMEVVEIFIFAIL